MDAAQARCWLDVLPNDLLGHVLAYCERTTETKLVCKRFYAVYAQYRLWQGLDKAFVADWVINLTGGTAEHCGMATSATLASFHAKCVLLGGRSFDVAISLLCSLSVRGVQRRTMAA